MRLNCYVTSFPFSGEDINGIDSSLQNEEKILKSFLPKIDEPKPEIPLTEEEELIKANPFVFMMNKAKMESMVDRSG